MGAPDPATTLVLILAFWEPRAPPPVMPTALPAEPGTVEGALTALQNAGAGHHTKRRTGKRTKQSPRTRRVRIIREPAHTPAPTTDRPTLPTTP
ncbi:hypothetical protein [Streptomyces sp. NPDC057052]|uniref:hypothetical protein n=1 Tax=Streptomyces sp. NPDC057052 TaxID=3346010 RepID=UPI00362F5EF5